MRILQVINKFQKRGAETFACQISNHFKRLGHDVLIVCLYDGDAKLPFNGSIFCLDAPPSTKYFNYFVLKRLAKVIKEFDPHIVQTNAGDTLKITVLSKKIFKWSQPIVVRNASELSSYIDSFWKYRFNKYLYKNINHVISVSKASEKDLLDHFPFLKGQTEVIPVGLEKVEVEKLVLHPPGAFHLIHVGSFTFEKNHIGLLKIMGKVVKANPNVFLHFIGEGVLLPEIKQQVEKFNLKNNIHFVGAVDNVLPFIKAANILVLPSISEGLPGVILEAMYCGTPVLAYRVGGISEVIDNQTGFLIDKNAEDGFAQRILNLIRFPSSDKTRTAKAMVLQNFMNEEISQRFLKSFQTLIKRI